MLAHGLAKVSMFLAASGMVWLAPLSALIAWAMALMSEPLILWFREVGL